MKRMLDGIIFAQITIGRFTIRGDTSIDVSFNFPEGYWPISLSSKPFNVLPGFVYMGQNPNVNDVCFSSTGEKLWSTVEGFGGSINMGYGYNNVDYLFNFANKANRDEFIERLFGKGATEDSNHFDTPVSAVLVKTLASAES